MIKIMLWDAWEVLKNTAIGIGAIAIVFAPAALTYNSFWWLMLYPVVGGAGSIICWLDSAQKRVS